MFNYSKSIPTSLTLSRAQMKTLHIPHHHFTRTKLLQYCMNWIVSSQIWIYQSVSRNCSPHTFISGRFFIKMSKYPCIVAGIQRWRFIYKMWGLDFVVYRDVVGLMNNLNITYIDDKWRSFIDASTLDLKDVQLLIKTQPAIQIGYSVHMKETYEYIQYFWNI